MKRTLLTLFLLTSGLMLKAGGSDSLLPLPQPEAKQLKIDSILGFSYRYIGTPYKYAGTSPQGFDCSGFVYYVFKNNLIDLPRTSRDMGTVGKKIPLDSAKPGDIILFKGTNTKSKVIGHAGIVVWRDGKDVQFIHSSSNKKRGGVMLSCFSDSPYYEKRFVKVVRVVE